MDASWSTAANLAWLRGLPGVKAQHPLAGHTSFNIGGPADFFVEITHADRLRSTVDGCLERGIPWTVIGAGTNLLVADAGIPGLVIRPVDRGHRVDGERIWAASGLKMLRLARLAAEANLTGLEFAIGIPGSVGGAVYQNAGCWGREVVDVVASVEGFLPGENGARRWSVAELGLGYRSSAFRSGGLKAAIITGAWFQLAPGDGESSRAEMARLVRQRTSTQPIRTRNCGSVFKNPADDSAGRLVDAVGMRGAKEGGAVVSPQHANFIVNTGGARAAEVVRLMNMIRVAVRDRFGIDLEPEVELVGRFDEVHPGVRQ